MIVNRIFFITGYGSTFFSSGILYDYHSFHTIIDRLCRKVYYEDNIYRKIDCVFGNFGIEDSGIMNVYIIFSATPNKLGRFIRTVTAEDYNHVSIAFSEEPQTMYSFGRRYYQTPLWGGFVAETPERYHSGKRSAEIVICCLPVEQPQYQKLKDTLKIIEANKERYLYNHLSAIVAPLHCRLQPKNAYTCAEFCAHILGQLGFLENDTKFYSISALMQNLKPYEVYEGIMPTDGQARSDYFQKWSAIKALRLTARDFFALFGRLRRA